MNGQKVPAFRGEFPDSSLRTLAKHAASDAAQKPRLLTTVGSCGHEISLKTERYSERGVRELALQLSKQPCGNCAESWQGDWRLAARVEHDRKADERRRARDGWEGL